MLPIFKKNEILSQKMLILINKTRECVIGKKISD